MNKLWNAPTRSPLFEYLISNRWHCFGRLGTLQHGTSLHRVLWPSFNSGPSPLPDPPSCEQAALQAPTITVQGNWATALPAAVDWDWEPKQTSPSHCFCQRSVTATREVTCWLNLQVPVQLLYRSKLSTFSILYVDNQSVLNNSPYDFCQPT